MRQACARILFLATLAAAIGCGEKKGDRAGAPTLIDASALKSSAPAETAPEPSASDAATTATAAASAPPVAPAAIVGTPDPAPAPGIIQGLIDAAAPWAVVEIPEGIHRENLKITKPLTLRGAAAERCGIEAISDEPAISIVGIEAATLENITVRWSTKSPPGTPIASPAAIFVQDSDATLKGCRLFPVNRPDETPFGLMALGQSEVAFIDGYSRGFAYAIAFTGGAHGSVESSILTAAGRTVVMIHPDSSAKITGNILSACGYHAVRNTGGTMEMTGNLVLNNKRAGAYLGNKPAHGMIKNNLFVGNGGAIWAYADSDVSIENNVMAQSFKSAIAFAPTCRLAIRRNLIADNPTGLERTGSGASGEGAELQGNLYWKNQQDASGLSSETPPVAGEKFFKAFETGDFSLNREALPKELRDTDAGLTDPKALLELWRRAHLKPGDPGSPTPAPSPSASPSPAKAAKKKTRQK